MQGHDDESDRDSDRNSDVEDEDNRDEDEDREGRFVETHDDPVVFQSKSLNELRPFYNGAVLDDRMAEIRKSIYYIRHHWDEFDNFMVSLKQLLLEDRSLEFKSAKTREHFDKLVSSKRDWLTKEQAKEAVLGYEAVKLYTSKEGHARMYRLSNDIFRKEELVSVETIRAVVFLVELINVDLFNYCQKVPERSNFEGVVYRGICLNEEDLAAFKSLRMEPTGRRNIAVPLGLFSASSSLDVAKRFMKEQMKKQKPGSKTSRPLLIKIHVIGLKPEYVEHYTRRFPTAVLTTICAVDIHRLSRHKDEREVLLRGPFMLILDVYEDNTIKINDQPCHVVEAVMLNANRDHISTSFLGDQDALARDMFGTMVTVTRSEFAREFCKNKHLTDDEQEYDRILDDAQRKLYVLMKQ